jgi:hypothetical protein
MSAIAAPFKTPRKKLVKGAPPDHSQALRHAIQLGFLALNAWIGIEFYLFVRYYETGGRSTFAARPAGVEGWLPIASLMNLKILLATAACPACTQQACSSSSRLWGSRGFSARASADGCARWEPFPSISGASGGVSAATISGCRAR